MRLNPAPLTVGDDQPATKLPDARFTDTGPTGSNGDGPEDPNRFCTRSVNTRLPTVAALSWLKSFENTRQ